ncbi:hypothetical protein HKX41_11290, partial [Salinisphaera sp. USBA-960]|nr:hypothetical protein [Salifodinibacter halophilus]
RPAASAPLDEFDDAIKRVQLPLAAVLTQALSLLKLLIVRLKWRIGQGEGDTRAVENAETLLRQIEQGVQVAPLQDWDGLLGSGVEEEESIQL